MSTKTNQKNIGSLVDAINMIFTGLIEEVAAQASKGKIKVDDIMTAIADSKFQDNLTALIKDNIPKATRSREKKLKDPEAPKRPKSSYLFFCDDHRAEVKAVNSELKMPDISAKLGEMWKALSEKKKAKYNTKAEQAKVAYKEAMENYERPSDEVLANLDVNQPRRRSKGDGKTKRKKDPNAPKRPMTAFLYFSQDKRAEVKDANPELKGTEIATELGRMWKEDFADEKSRMKWVKKATADKERYEEEMKGYTPPAKDDSEEAAPKKKRGRPSKDKTMSKEEKGDDEDEETETETAPKAAAKPAKSKSKEAEEPKAAAKPAKTKTKVKPPVEELTEEDLFGDDE